MLKGYRKVSLSHHCSVLSGKGPRSRGLPPSGCPQLSCPRWLIRDPWHRFSLSSVSSSLHGSCEDTVCKALHCQCYLQLLWFRYFFFLPPHPPPCTVVAHHDKGGGILLSVLGDDGTVRLLQIRSSAHSAAFRRRLLQDALMKQHGLWLHTEERGTELFCLPEFVRGEHGSPEDGEMGVWTGVSFNTFNLLDAEICMNVPKCVSLICHNAHIIYTL